MEIIRELADLERERDRITNRLRRRACQTISRINFSELEEEYSHLKEVHSRFLSKVEDWTELLETNEDGEPEYPQRGMPESRYSPDNEELTRKASLIEEVLISTRETLLKFIVSLPAPEQILLVQEAILPFLRNLDVIKAHFAERVVGDAEDQEEEEEEETNTVVPPHVENPEDTQDAEENIQERDEVRSNHSSPNISLASSKKPN